MSAISLALAPLRVIAINRAEEYASRQIGYVRAALEAVNMDLDVFAPYPRGTLSRPAYAAAIQRRTQATMMTVPDEGGARCQRHTDPHYRRFTDKSCADYLAMARAQASADFDAFVTKLEARVGAHNACDAVFGDNVWAYSIITVTATDGTVTRWKTQQIVNVSKLGKVFNQWPTRPVK